MPQKLKNNKQLINHLKPYPKYKDSGVEWLGKVPDGWNVIRNKAFLRFRTDTVGEQSDNYTLLSLTLRGIIKRNMENPQGKFPAEFNTYKVVKPGDLVFCLFDVDETPRTVGLSDYEGMITGAYDVVYSSNQNVIDYLYQYYLSIDNVKGLRPLYSGLRKVVPKDVFMNMRIAIPPDEEQSAIVRYLSYTTSRINTYIAAKKKLIKLLEEQKQAIIHQAVTGAIDVNTGKPYPKYKESGVEWLGQVPTDWQVEKLKQSVISCVNGIWGGEPNGDDDIFCVRVADFDKTLNKVVLNNMTYRAVTQAERSSRLLKNGSLLIEKSGGGELQPVGNVVLFDHNIPAVCSNFIGKMTVANGYDPEFLCYLHSALYSIGLNVRSIKQTTGIQNLDIHSYLNEYVAFPSITGQTAIVHYLKKTLFVISKSIDIAKQEINLLHEYKTRLTADVVTGKVDVREMTLL